jgi:lysyl-tRNA synthetase class I
VVNVGAPYKGRLIEATVYWKNPNDSIPKILASFNGSSNAHELWTMEGLCVRKDSINQFTVMIRLNSSIKVSDLNGWQSNEDLAAVANRLGWHVDWICVSD